MKNHLVLSMAIAFSLTACGGDKSAELQEKAAAPVAQAAIDTSDPKVYHQDILGKYVPQKVADRVYVIHGPTEMPTPENAGFMNNPGFIIGSESVVVIDPGSSGQAGRSVVQRIKELTDKPITHVFVTHIHGDHWLGNQGIKEAFPEAKFYAHPKMIEMANEGEAESWVKLMMTLTDNKTAGTEAVIPDQVLAHVEELNIGDITIRAHFTEHAHTVTDVMFEVVEDKVLFTGDNITYKRIPRMTDGNFKGNIAAANYGLEMPIDVVVPGHGPTGGKEVLTAYRDYLATVYESAEVMMEEGLEAFEMKDAIVEKLAEYKEWPGMMDEVGKHISLAVTELEEASF
ncbi:MAG: Unknown protein [uncultured Thiotrichaceae bacterium]|uniref:Metallo-beta-lactamase domain-containing protein n=1 Tax=uncultured Thiotrichaceae bacterium TaxID=298394 RepID=A0A6S6U9D9_9GAMM|nr:MAG: Unknown protein [uncultured Thiotrichaceae bacterium]